MISENEKDYIQNKLSEIVGKEPENGDELKTALMRLDYTATLTMQTIAMHSQVLEPGESDKFLNGFAESFKNRINAIVHRKD